MLSPKFSTLSRTFFLFALAVCNLLNAQIYKVTKENIVLDKFSEPSTHYESKTKINLKPGFGIVGGRGIGKSILSINEAGVIDAPTDLDEGFTDTETENYFLNTDLEVGEISGNFSASATGDAYYNVPLELPKGAGLMPTLGLMYMSRVFEGKLGLSWDLTGISEITRGRNTNFFDGNEKNYAFQSTDAFFLNGDRLVLTQGNNTSYAGLVEFRLANNPKIIIKPILVDDEIDGFLVLYPDGRKFEFGGDGAKVKAQQGVVKWKLKRVTDTFKNTMVYDYFIDFNENTGYECRVSKIAYSGNVDNGENHLNEIFFKYKEKPIPNIFFNNNIKSTEPYLLEEITTTVNGSKDLSYKFEYTYNKRDVNKYSLYKIWKFNRDNEPLNPLQINWGFDDRNPAQIGAAQDFRFKSVSGADCALVEGLRISMSDYRNNGREVLLVTGDSCRNSSTIQNYRRFNIGLGEYLNPNEINYSRVLYSGMGIDPRQQEVLRISNPVDFDGDGVQDIAMEVLEESSLTQNGITTTTKKVFTKLLDAQSGALKSKAGAAGQFKFLMNFEDYPLDTAKKYVDIPGDFNNDGFDDLASITLHKVNLNAIPGSHNQGYIYKVILRSLDMEETNLFTSEFSHRAVSFADLVQANDPIVSVGDFNNDQVPELFVYVGGVLGVYAYSSTNQAFQEIYSTEHFFNTYSNLGKNLIPMDYNADGIMDVVINDVVNNTLDVHLGTGQASFRAPISYPQINLGNLNLDKEAFESLVVKDVNYDGKLDFVKFDKTSGLVILFLNNGFQVKNGITELDLVKDFIPLSTDFFEDKNNDIQFVLGDFEGNGKLTFAFNEIGEGIKLFNAGAFYHNHLVKSIKSPLKNDVVLEFNKMALGNLALNDFAFNEKLKPNAISVLPLNRIAISKATMAISKGVQQFQSFRFARPLYSHIYGMSPGINTYNVNTPKKSMRYTADIDTVTNNLFLRKKEVFTTLNGVLEKTQESNYTAPRVLFSPLDPTEKLRIIYTPSINSTNFVTNVNTTVNMVKNNWGNTIKSLENVTDNTSGETFTALNLYLNFYLTENNVPRAPTKVIMGKQRSTAAPLFVSEQVSYQDNILQTEIISEISSIDAVSDIANQASEAAIIAHKFNALTKVDYTYDLWGNLLENTSTTNEISDKTIMEYEATGRFLTKMIDKDGDETNFTVNPQSGVVQKVSDKNGLETTMQYNAWDRMLKQDMPDGTFSNTQRTWGNYASDALFSETSTSLGRSPVTTDISRSATATTTKSYNNIDITEQYNYSFDPITDITEIRETPIRVKDLNAQNYEGLLEAIENDMSVSTTKDALNRTLSVKKQVLFVGGRDSDTETNYTYNKLNISRQLLDKNSNHFNRDKSTLFNALGEPITLFDEHGNAAVNIFYDSFGRINKRMLGDRIISYTYDKQGNLISEEDEQAGTTTYTYDKRNRLISYQDYRGQNTNLSYDEKDRPKTMASNTGNFTYHYDAQHKESLDKVEIGDKLTMEFEYDAITRPNKVTETYDEQSSTTHISYDDTGRVSSTAIAPNINLGYSYYPNGAVKNISVNGTTQLSMEHYSVTGQLKAIRFGNGQLLERYLKREINNPTSNYTNVDLTKANDLEVTLNGLEESDLILRANPDNLSHPNRGYFNQALFHEQIARELHTGNVVQRRLNKTPENQYNPSFLTETFLYDELDRLTRVYHSNQSDTFKYDAFGNMTYHSGFGSLHYPILGGISQQSYKSQKPKQIAINPDALNPYSLPQQNIVYNAMGLPIEIKVLNQAGELAYSTYITYDAMGKRRVLKHYKNGALVCTKKYFSNYISIQRSGQEEKKYYPVQHQGILLMMLVESSAGVEPFYIVQDYLGSIRLVVNQAGHTVHQYSYDAWGRPRDADTWQALAFSDISYFADMGYTGQEYLENTQLYHYNARLYDPISCRMLSADKYISQPINGQSYNRYSYVMNNPLKYTDPSGWISYQPAPLAPVGGGVDPSTITTSIYVDGVRYDGQFASTLLGLYGQASSGSYVEGLGSVASHNNNPSLGALIIARSMNAGRNIIANQPVNNGNMVTPVVGVGGYEDVKPAVVLKDYAIDRNTLLNLQEQGGGDNIIPDAATLDFAFNLTLLGGVSGSAGIGIDSKFNLFYYTAFGPSFGADLSIGVSVTGYYSYDESSPLMMYDLEGDGAEIELGVGPIDAVSGGDLERSFGPFGTFRDDSINNYKTESIGFSGGTPLGLTYRAFVTRIYPF